MKGAGSRERYAPVARVLWLGGFTLVEVIVVVAILGLIFGVSALAFTSLRVPRELPRFAELRRARAQAIHTGRAVRAVAPTGTGGDRSLLPAPLFLPDGRALGPGVDPLTGAPLDAPR